MTKIPSMRLSLLALIALAVLSRSMEAAPQEFKGETFYLEKNTVNHIELLKFAKRNPSDPSRLLRTCPPAPPAPVFGTVITQASGSPAVTFFPNNSVTNGLVPPPQTLGLTFTAASQSINPSLDRTPPATMGVAGPTQFVLAFNNGLITYNKSGTLDNALFVEPQTFLNLDNDFSTFIDTLDPRIRYDQSSGRYFFIYSSIDDKGLGINNGISIAVSDTGTLSNSTKWSVVNIFNNTVLPDSTGCPGDQGTYLDFPTLGIDANALYIGFDIKGAGGIGYISNSVLVVQKSSLLAQGPAVITAFRDVIVPQYPGDAFPFRSANVIQGVDNFDANPTFGYLIGNDPLHYGLLNLYRVSNPGGTSPTLTGPISFTVPNTGSTAQAVIPLGSQNLFGSLGTLQMVDDRPSSAHIRNKELYTCQLILCNSSGIGTASGDRSGVRWYQLDTTGDTTGSAGGVETVTTVPALVQAGTLFDPTSSGNPQWYNVPTLMTNLQGDLVIGGTVSSNLLPTLAFFVGRVATDTLGTLRIGATSRGTVFATGAGSYARALGLGDANGNGQPWGNYSYTSLDPVDNLTMWTIQEIALNGIETLVVAKLLAP